MQRMMKKTIFAFCSLMLISNVLLAFSFEERKKTQMIQDLEVIKHHFEAAYAPAEWKKEHMGWNLNEAFEQSKNQILETSSITTKQFQQIVRDFVKTAKDYHVDVTFFSTEKASLPFSVKGIEDRYFVNWVNVLRLPPAYYGIQEGDELLEFDGRPIVEVMADLRKECGKSANQNTDDAIASMKLTMRAGIAGDHVPKGPILVTIRSAETDRINTYQLHWSYTPEQIKNALDFTDFLDCISFLLPDHKNEKKLELPSLVMANPLHQAFAQNFTDRHGGLGSRKSFLPFFGEVLWSNEKEKIKEEKKEKEKIPFWHAYIYQHPQGYKIGYIRIPHYISSLTKVNAFGNILNMMEEDTDALVIDQLHNFGGLVHIQYALASILTHYPLQAPYHRIKITQKEAIDAYETLEFIKQVEMMLSASEFESPKNSENEQEQDQSQKEENDRGLNYQELLFLKTYCELVLEDWNNGMTLTHPTPILGVDKINPHPQYQYTHPILMLIDEMDFSGGDFMPAILQDNKRAVLFGARTAGAGGYVFSFQFPNTHGIAQCSYTASLAERTNQQKIENLGVTPDIPYQVTLEDVKNGYQGYIEAVNQAIHNLLNKEKIDSEDIFKWKCASTTWGI